MIESNIMKSKGRNALDKIKKVLHNINQNKPFGIFLLFFYFFAASYGIVFLSQYLLGAGTASLDKEKIRLAMLCVCMVFLVIYAVTRRVRLSIIIGSILLVGLATANYYVYQFRGNELSPSDILALGTAINVAGNYVITPEKNIIIAWIILLVVAVISIFLPEYRWKSIWKPRVVCVGVLAVFLLVFLNKSANHYVIFWELDGTKNNGYLLNFSLQIKDLFVPEPEGYSVDVIESMSEKYSSTTEIGGPDIIVIMDEAFSDLSVLGKAPVTNTEVMPFINSLKENTIKGYTAVSVIGGNTANSEYEFLTGNSSLYLQNVSIPYQQYIKQPVYSVVSDMKNRDYKCIGMHPYYKNGWARSSVYEYLGFDETYFIEDFPNKNLIRSYISDQEMFEKVIEEYERNKKENDQSLFLFGVTMQNHGGYTYEGPNYEPSVRLEGYQKEYKDAEQYLSLIHETDKAVEYLLNYFTQEEREVIVVFFGDHQPSLDEEFMNEISDVDYDTAEERLRRYMVPFFVWANYDIPEKEIELIGLNYMMNEVYEAADMELPPYNLFLEELRRVIPYMNKYAYYSVSQQAFSKLETAKEKEKEMLDLYAILEYNNMFDHKKRNKDFFPLANE